jgi:hypothetical protein
MKLTLPPQKLVEKPVWVSVISLCKVFNLSYAFDALLCQNWLFSPPLNLVGFNPENPNGLRTLHTTLLTIKNL